MNAMNRVCYVNPRLLSMSLGDSSRKIIFPAIQKFFSFAL